jgi:hypothetical protein
VVVSASGPLAAIATTNDMSCGHSVSFVRAGPRWIMRLQGGGADGTYVARYGWRRGRFVSLGVRSRASDL